MLENDEKNVLSYVIHHITENPYIIAVVQNTLEEKQGKNKQENS